jgi:murein DD-endopeptidase
MQTILILAALMIVATTASAAAATGNQPQPVFAWPVKIPIRITSNFTATRGNKAHAAIDIAAPIGTPVYSIGNGVIDSIWNDPAGGLSLRIKHDNGFKSGYAHLSKNSFLKLGAPVKVGDRIGTSGNSGKTTGPHLHLKVYNANGVAINPINILPPL